MVVPVARSLYLALRNTFKVCCVLLDRGLALLNDKCAALEIKIEDQYDKIDAIKLDKDEFLWFITKESAYEQD